MGLVLGLVLGLLSGLVLGLLFGVVLWLLGLGGPAVIQHYVLRLLLWRSDAVPLQLVPFCDRCVDLVLLRRTGGSYIFIHRMLLDCLASLEPSFTHGPAGQSRGERD